MSTKDIGCFFCHGKSRLPSDACPACSQPLDIGSDLLLQVIGDYRPQRILGRGFYGWTLLVEDDLGQKFALKLLPHHRLKDRPLHEAKALIQCSAPPHRNIARFFRRIEPTVQVRGHSVPAIGMLFDYIADARPLREVIESLDVPLSRVDLLNILAGVAWGLVRLSNVGLWHNDLHDDNILVRRVSPDEGLAHQFEAVVIDFGSAAAIDPETPEDLERGDYYYLGKHIFGLVARFEESQPRLIPPDRSLADYLRRLAHRMMEPHFGRRSADPQSIAEQLDAALKHSGSGHNRPALKSMLETRRVSIRRPLENSNALTLAPQDIPFLFQDDLEWEAQLARSETVIVTGPRGCGKTMLLRYLSISSQAWPLRLEESVEAITARLATIPFIGFFVSCIDLRTPFLRSSYKQLETIDPNAAQDFCREYLNLQICAEVARCLEWLRLEGLAPMQPDQLAPLADRLIALIDGPEPAPGIRGADLEMAIELLDRRIAMLSNFGRTNLYQPSNFCRDDILVTIARAVATIPWVEDKEVRFFIDDYSAAVLTPFVQRAMNPILFHPSPYMRVKLSSEGDGPELSDAEGRKYKEGRELTKVNLGELYFQADEAGGRAFIEAILERRCKETEYGSVRSLVDFLGEHPEETRFGDYIRSMSKSGRAGNARFHGFGLVCRLCSGDVSYVIELLRAIVGDEWLKGGIVPPEQQDAVIKRFAHSQLTDLKRVNRYGTRLYQFASNVGVILRDFLVKSRDRADERLRIEVEGAGSLSTEALEIHQELLRHSVLIDGGFGKSRSGTTTRKFFFRRLFAPCFPFSPTRRGCIPLSVERYESWLRNPSAIARPADALTAWERGLGSLGGEVNEPADRPGN